jgi:outer membrane lipoprotein SlyB
MKRIALTALFASLFGISAGASAIDLSGAGFTAQQLRSGADVYAGTVEQMLSASADKSTNGGSAVGTGVGAVLGGLAGNSVGNGNGKTATTILGTVLGGIAGNAVSSIGQTDVCSLTFILKLDGVQKLQSVTQECTAKYQYAIGQKVYLLVAKSDNTMRVVPAQ